MEFIRDNERFKRIEEFPDYFAGDQGTIISFRVFKNGEKMSGKFDKDGYKEYQIRTPEGHRKYRRGHRLIAQTFLGDPPKGKPVVNHKNGIKDDNRLENLEWCSLSENALHSFRVLGTPANITTAIFTALYEYPSHKLIKIFESGTELGRYIGVSGVRVASNRKLNDTGARHNRKTQKNPDGYHLMKRKYYCKTYSEESVETIEQGTDIA